MLSSASRRRSSGSATSSWTGSRSRTRRGRRGRRRRRTRRTRRGRSSDASMRRYYRERWISKSKKKSKSRRDGKKRSV
jgi:hypothetical protein